MHFIIPTLQLRRRGGRVTGDTCLLRLAPAEAGLEIQLVVCMCQEVSLPTTSLRQRLRGVRVPPNASPSEEC